MPGNQLCMSIQLSDSLILRLPNTCQSERGRSSTSSILRQSNTRLISSPIWAILQFVRRSIECPIATQSSVLEPRHLALTRQMSSLRRRKESVLLRSTMPHSLQRELLILCWNIRKSYIKRNAENVWRTNEQFWKKYDKTRNWATCRMKTQTTFQSRFQLTRTLSSLIATRLLSRQCGGRR